MVGFPAEEAEGAELLLLLVHGAQVKVMMPGSTFTAPKHTDRGKEEFRERVRRSCAQG